MTGKADKQDATMKAIVKTGTEKIASVLDDHIDRVLHLRKNMAVKDSSLVSDSLANKIPLLRWHTRMKVSSLRAHLIDKITQIASDYEEDRFKKIEQTLKQNKNLNKLQMDRGKEVIDIEKNLFISYNALVFAFRICANYNDTILNRIASASLKPDEELELLLKNALIVYEISSMIITMITEFQMHGEANFKALYKEVLKELADREREAARLVAAAHANSDISVGLRMETTHRERAMKENTAVVREEWIKLQAMIASFRGSVEALKKDRNIAELRLSRDMAKNQLDFLEIVSVTRVLKQNFTTMQDMININLSLANLEPADIGRLIGDETMTDI
ncbi:hypothetical protein IFT64_16145 [Oxalobacteraceae sp. CFBP 8753]|nr:hypothetical protein [Oxalobacteraceae sp. CFBP 8753]